MGKFINTLITEDDLIKRKDRKRFRIHERPFVYVTNAGLRVIVHVGFRTDFASVPKPFRVFVSTVGLHNGADVIHDYLIDYKIVSRKQADRIFLEALKDLGVGWYKRRKMYMGVRSYSMTFGKLKK
jgi:hypothetical protein